MFSFPLGWETPSWRSLIPFLQTKTPPVHGGLFQHLIVSVLLYSLRDMKLERSAGC